MNFMSRCLMSVAIIAATTIEANAAPAPVNTIFSGFYVGANAGYSWGRGNTTTTTSTTLLDDSYFEPEDIVQINGNGWESFHLNSAVGGVQAGYNFQYGNFLLGLESSFDWLNGSASNTRQVTYLVTPEASFTLYRKIGVNGFVTLCPKLGVVINRMLFYVTGGFEFSQLRAENTFSDNFVGTFNLPSNAFESVNQSQGRIGGVFGGGVEYALTRHLFVNAEYLYADFGKISSRGRLYLNPQFLASFNPPLVDADPFNHSAKFRMSFFRLGINYNFS